MPLADSWASRKLRNLGPQVKETTPSKKIKKNYDPQFTLLFKGPGLRINCSCTHVSFSYKPENGTQPGFTDVSCSGYQQHILRCSYEQTNEQCTAAVVVECGELRLYTCS